VQVALDAPQLGGLDVEGARAGAGQLGDALLELALAWRRHPGDDDGVRAECEPKPGDDPRGPEVPAAGQRVDRQLGEHQRPGARTVERERAVAPRGHLQRPPHGELDDDRERQGEDHPHRPEVAAVRDAP
jgi:hypothetical protein